MIDPKPTPRIVDRTATTRKLLADSRECRACGRAASSGHHVIPKGERGDDVVENVVPLCGDGASGCHGALHGNPYTVQVGNWALDVERRDAEWVRRRIGERLRPDELMYVGYKLGADAGSEFLRRHYYVATIAYTGAA